MLYNAVVRARGPLLQDGIRSHRSHSEDHNNNRDPDETRETVVYRHSSTDTGRSQRLRPVQRFVGPLIELERFQ